MKQFILIFAFAICNAVLAQNPESAKRFIGEGIVLHDKGDYKGAVTKYDLALKADTFNLTALAERAMTYNAMGEYDKAIKDCKLAIKKHPGKKDLENVYVIYGNTYDLMKKPNMALEIYGEGIVAFPKAYMLYFNKGITFNGLEKNDSAMEYFKMSSILNPNHAGSQNALGRLYYVYEKNKIAGLLSLLRFLVIEPKGSRAVGNVEIVNSILNSGAQKTGKNTYTISIDELSLDTTAKEDDFSSESLILTFAAALDGDKQFKKQNSAQKLQRKLDGILSSVSESKKVKEGFCFDYYIPYFQAMKKKGYLETFSYIAMASAGDKKVNKWIKTHSQEIVDFYKWDNAYKFVEED